VPVNYITISKWCENWLIDDYNQKPKYAPNGIDTSKFKPKKREFNSDKKIRVLVEGNSNDYYKNVDESFEIVSKLDKDKYEIWFMSYLGKPRKWYRVDKFLHKIPYEKVPKVYQDCDILLKSSILESFSYPPLEMMSTGGFVVVAPNEGNIEYLQHEKNCLLYEQGNVYSAVKAIERICSDKLLCDDLYNGGLETSKKRDWNIVYNAILSLYED
jgi:glycosyltransferase involved in cell wall biosynthesis